MAKLSDARLLAREVGSAVRLRSAFAGDVLDAKLKKVPLSIEDRAFARVLCLGVAATWGTLDEVIDRCLRSPEDIKPDVRDALRISTYEIIFLKKDSYAVVDQGVELVRSVAPRASGVANAVLRKIGRAAEQFPFGNPETNDAALARLYAFPLWLAQLLIATLGRQQATAFMQASNEPAPVFLGVNSIKTDPTKILTQFGKKKVDLRTVSLSEGKEVSGCLKIDDTSQLSRPWVRSLFDNGDVLVSDAVAQYIALLALPNAKPRTFLEVGSGRGTKTILLQSNAQRIYGEQMNLTAVDSIDFKTDLLKKRAGSYGVHLDRVVKTDARKLSGTLEKQRFDAALLDAPCSGLGTLRRHPEIRWRITPETIETMAKLQLQMLCEVARVIEVGGRLTYATCTVAALENEGVVKRFLETEVGKHFRIIPVTINASSPLFCKTELRSGSCDAHFAAVFIRID